MSRRLAAVSRIGLVTLLALVTAGAGFSYHFFLHYAGRTAPFTPIPEKFDLTALADKTLQYHISDVRPEPMAGGDSFAAVVSQIRAAAKVWNDVETSDLRLAFGGLMTPGTEQSRPSLEISFEEVPPGIIAMGGPVSRAQATPGPASFVPITKAVVIFRKDMSQRASSSDGFFFTAVHEIGHALGLQHSMASGAMSTDPTRATTRFRPLGADDVAAISLLYPTGKFAASTGSITGRVMLDGQGVHLASVVAITPDGPAITALADPGGYYRIEGLRPGQYIVYAHPLPPAVQAELGPADVVLPVDADSTPFPAGPVFGTQFWPGTNDSARAVPVTVTAGEATPSIDFAVASRGPLPVYGVTTYSFPASVAVKPAFLNVNGSRNFLVASGVGLTAEGQPAPGLGVSVMGSSATVPPEAVKAYPPAPTFLQVGFQFDAAAGEGPRHLVFSRDGDIFVLPSGLNLTTKQPPSIASLAAGTDALGRKVAVLTGAGLDAATRVLFDGEPGQVLGFDEVGGQLTVLPPQGASSHAATVVAIASDGQSSSWMHAAPVFTYDAADAQGLEISPAALAAGSETMVEITGVNTNFSAGQTVVGFGSSDVSVRRLWVVSPTRILANVAVAATAPTAVTQVTVTTGFEIVARPGGFQVLPPDGTAVVAGTRLWNPITGAYSVYAGGPAVLALTNFQPPPGGVNAIRLTLNDVAAAVLSATEGQIGFQVPAELGAGKAVLRVQIGDLAVPPVIVLIDPMPPRIVSLTNESGAAIGPNQPAKPGEKLTAAVSGLVEPGAALAANRLRVTVGGLDHAVTQVVASETDPAVQLVQFTLSASIEVEKQYLLSVSVDGRPSLPFLLLVR